MAAAVAESKQASLAGHRAWAVTRWYQAGYRAWSPVAWAVLAAAGHRAEVAGQVAQAATRGLQGQLAAGNRQALGLGQQTRTAVAQQEASAGHGTQEMASGQPRQGTLGPGQQTWAAETEPMGQAVAQGHGEWHGMGHGRD